MSTDYEQRNRAFWDADADDYQALHGEQLAGGRRWGTWAIPDDDVGVLGDVGGLDVLELGCGGAQWSIALARDGARAVGLDQSRAQLRHARDAVGAAAVRVPLVCASAEAVPFADASFDLVFCDHGAMSFCEPARSVPEVARVLRAGGRLVFNKATHLMYLTYDWRRRRQDTRLGVGFFEQRVFSTGEGSVDFHVGHGEWIRLFRAHGLAVEDLVELRAPEDPTTTYVDFVPHDWARRWPAEEIWTVRKT